MYTIKLIASRGEDEIKALSNLAELMNRNFIDERNIKNIIVKELSSLDYLAKAYYTKDVWER